MNTDINTLGRDIHGTAIELYSVFNSKDEQIGWKVSSDEIVSKVFTNITNALEYANTLIYKKG